MNGFILKTSEGQIIRFKYYQADAPATCIAFAALLPFTRTFMHARVSGQEIWIDDAPPLDVIQENASVFTGPGEVVYGPKMPNAPKPLTAWAFIMEKAGAWMPVIFLPKYLMRIWRN